MTGESHRLVGGYMASFSVRRRVEDGATKFDVEIGLISCRGPDDGGTVVRFRDVRNCKYGDGRDGIDFGARLCLSIDDISGHGWDGVGFKVYDVESDSRLSLYCRSFDIDASANAYEVWWRRRD